MAPASTQIFNYYHNNNFVEFLRPDVCHFIKGIILYNNVVHVLNIINNINIIAIKNCGIKYKLQWFYYKQYY